MDEETNSSLVSVSVPLSVPLDLARGDVDLGVDVTNSGSSYWSLGPPTQQQQQPGLLVSVSELARLGGTRPPATDSRLVGVPTMGRVIPMSELNRLGIPEMRIVLQSDTKLEDDLDQLDMPVISETVMAVSESTGDFFVADGYCNSRIMKYSKDGKLKRIISEYSSNTQ